MATLCQIILIFGSNLHLLKNQTRYICFNISSFLCLREKKRDWETYRDNCQFIPVCVWPQYASEIVLISVTQRPSHWTQCYSQIIFHVFSATFDTSDSLPSWHTTSLSVSWCNIVVFLPPSWNPFCTFGVGISYFTHSLNDGCSKTQSSYSITVLEGLSYMLPFNYPLFELISSLHL